MVRISESIQKKLLKQLHQVPIEHRPFHVMAQRLGISEQECLEHIQQLKDKHFLSGIRAELDGRALGYDCAMVAMCVNPTEVDQAAAVLCDFPGTVKCDIRNDAFNLWATLYINPNDTLDRTVQVLHALAGAEQTLILPTLKLYKLRESSTLTGEESWCKGGEDLSTDLQPTAVRPSLDKKDLVLLRALQEDLPLLEMPFNVIAAQTGIKERELFERMRSFEQQGLLVNFGADIHRKRPYKSHAVVLWEVPEGRIDAIGNKMARMRPVSHCFRKPTYPKWPYSLYSVIQGESQEATKDAINQVAERLGQFPHKSLFSLNTLKSVPIKYFSLGLSAWWKKVPARLKK